MSFQHLLNSVYNYFGAHTVQDRVGHERSRCVQRMVHALVVAPLGLWAARSLDLTDMTLTSPVIVIALFYGLIAAGYFQFLGRFPQGGVGAQYTFMVTDSFIMVGTILAEPRGLGWLSVLLLGFVTRTGVRYGMRSMGLSWGSAIAAAILFAGMLITPTSWKANSEMYLVLAIALIFGPPLFFDAIRALTRARELELRRIKLGSLEDALKARNAFLSRLSHELKSPVQTIRTSVDLLLKQVDQPLSMKTVDRLYRAAGNLDGHLSDLVTLASGEAGGLTLRPERVQLNRLIDELADIARDFAAPKGLRLVVDAPEDLGTVVIDQLRLSEIVENLLTNAVKYTDRGQIDLRVLPFDPVTGLLHISVSDTGQGIEPESLSAIFETYERAGARTYNEQSSGIGLAVVQTLLEYLGGRVSVQSTVGVGSTFFVEVPALLPADVVTDTTNGRALVIESEDASRQAIARTISEFGLRVEVAATVGAASNLLADRTYDVVWFDLQLPVKSGTALASDVRRHHGPNQDSYFVAIAAATDEEKASIWPFNAITKRPVTSRMIKRILNEKTQMQELM